MNRLLTTTAWTFAALLGGCGGGGPDEGNAANAASMDSQHSAALAAGDNGNSNRA